MMARRAGKSLRRLRGGRKRKGKDKDRRSERRPFRPHGWFGKRRKSDGRQRSADHKAETLESRRWKPGRVFVALAFVLLAAATLPQAVMADGHERWQDEIDFEIEEPVEGRRIFVEGLSVSGDRAAVTLRAAADIDIRVRAFGGSQGTVIRFWGSATLAQGESIDYSLPLHGPVPSFTVSWTDSLGQAGAVTVEHDRIPFPLPQVEGELCNITLASLGWTSGAVSGVIESECVTHIEHSVELQTVAGHESVTETALLDARVTDITGALDAETGASTASVPFVPNGETLFALPVGVGEAVHAVSLDVSLEASLSIPIPPLTQLTHQPERTERRTETVSLWRPGTTETVSETVTVTNDDGTTTEHAITATLSIPGETVQEQVTLTIVHPEHVKAEVVEREPLTRSREEQMSLASAVGSDDPYAALALPEPEPEDPPAEQSPADGLRGWFERLGWEWPW